MSGVERFEDLVAWQEARKLAQAVYRITGDGKFAKDYGLSGQIQRAAVSIMSNIAEGFSRHNPNEFHQFLVIALGSSHEVRSQLYIAQDIGYITKAEFDQVYGQVESVSRLVGALRASLKNRTRNNT